MHGPVTTQGADVLTQRGLVLCAVIGGLLVPFMLTVGALPQRWAVCAAVLLLCGEFTERWLFFTSVAPEKMPGLQS